MTATQTSRSALRNAGAIPPNAIAFAPSSPRSTTGRGRVARRPAWLKLPELGDANRATQSDCPSLATLSPLALAVRTKSVLKHEIPFIANPLFSDPDAPQRIFEQPLGLGP